MAEMNLLRTVELYSGRQYGGCKEVILPSVNRTIAVQDLSNDYVVKNKLEPRTIDCF